MFDLEHFIPDRHERYARRMRKKLLLTGVAIPTGLALLLGVEVMLAVRGAQLPETEPFDLSGMIGDEPGKPLRFAWIGDSVSAGVGASEAGTTFPHLVADALDRPAQLHVFALSGARTSGALADQVPKVLALDPPPDVVVVEIGANDVIHLTGTATFRLSYDLLLEQVRRVGASHVLALGLPAFGATPRFLQPLRALVGWRADRLDREVQESASEHGVTYVDIAGRTGPRFEANPEGTHADDDFHPNDAGYRLWAEAVLRVLRPLLARAQG